MQISSISTTPQMAQMAKASGAPEGPGPNNDGDGDDSAVTSPTLSATAPGVGNSIDVST